MTVYLDTSVVVSLFLEEQRGAKVAELISTADLLTSDLLIGEFGAAVSMAVRTKRLSEGDADRTNAMFDGWIAAAATRLEIDRDAFAAASAWVRRRDFALQFPDALHIAVCRTASARLITGDKQQAQAAAALEIDVEFVD